VFGFKSDDDVFNENHRVLREAGLLVHGARIVDMLDGALALLGPDEDLLEEILGQLGKRHQSRGVKKEYFPLLGKAIRESLASTMGDYYTDDHDAAWEEVFGEISALIVKSMT
jgi:ribosomal 50S subunit-associated protein YjgA (DUF615 family)